MPGAQTSPHKPSVTSTSLTLRATRHGPSSTALDSSGHLSFISLTRAGSWIMPFSYYTDLQELHCVDFNYRQKPKPLRHYYTRPSIVDQSQNALRLIEFCPKLLSLTVDHLSREYRADHYTEDIFKFICIHTSLATIKIHLESVPFEFSTVLIKSLPASWFSPAVHQLQ
ncbi:hypothetical protein BGX30_001952 [Mortierella sp. GBA39]|nr:hypothetical protein BGX30_001952 [Mortierella sp. GBA39]